MVVVSFVDLMASHPFVMGFQSFDVYRRPYNVLLNLGVGLATAKNLLCGHVSYIVSSYSTPMHFCKDLTSFKFNYVPLEYLIIAHFV